MHEHHDMHDDNEVNTIEMLTHKRFNNFCRAIKKARALKNLETLNPYDLHQYAQVLINGAIAIQTLNISQCNDRYDLVDDNQEAANALEKKYKQFANDYLGLDLAINGDPRGCAFKLVVDKSLGDSFGDREHLCVPQMECAVCFV
jgi:hypothetical protein